MIREITLRVINERLIPKKATSKSTGYDLYANIETPLEIKKGKWERIPTGVYIQDISNDIDVQIRSRSGLVNNYGIFVLNGIGTIDADYRGEICVILANFSDKDYIINPYDRIAQLVFASIPAISLNIKDNDYNLLGIESAKNIRGEGGFGSTGK